MLPEIAAVGKVDAAGALTTERAEALAADAARAGMSVAMLPQVAAAFSVNSDELRHREREAATPATLGSTRPAHGSFFKLGFH